MSCKTVLQALLQPCGPSLNISAFHPEGQTLKSPGYPVPTRENAIYYAIIARLAAQPDEPSFADLDNATLEVLQGHVLPRDGNAVDPHAPLGDQSTGIRP